MFSLLEWSAFAFYWSAVAKNASRSVESESPASRRLHVILLNLAFLFVILPVREWSPRFLPDAGWIAWLGLGGQTPSLAFAVWARRCLTSQWSGEIAIKVDHELVRVGPYRFVRHAIYTAMLGMFLGSTVISGSLLPLLGFIAVTLAYRRKILLEEANLQRAFGTTYELYCRRTGALLPKLRA